MSVQPCSSATSPLAYLADLLDYTTKHVKDGTSPVTLPALAATFHQPFADLPGDCACMDREVSEARLAVDILRRYLKAKGLPASGTPTSTTLAQVEKAYCVAAYDSLLRQWGTSFDEIRLARTGTPVERAALASRIGIDAGKLSELPADPDRVTEAVLDRLFGLADSTRDPLSEGAKSGDPQGQITRWSLGGAIWKRNTDANGAIHLRLRKNGNTVEVTAFRDAARTQQIASGTRNGESGPVTLAPSARSGLSGKVSVRYVADSDTIAITVLPAVLGWRLDHLREQWLQQNAATDSSLIIDPDIVLHSDLRYPIASDPAFALWKSRRDLVDGKLTELRGLRRGAANAKAAFDAVLVKANLPPAKLQSLADRLAKGENIVAELDALPLRPAAFSHLLRIQSMAAGNSAILEAEWADVESIAVQAIKGSMLGAWRAEEATKVSLSPAFFQPVTAAPDLPKWRADAAARRDWQASLSARTDQEQALIASLQVATRTADEMAMPALRDALIQGSDAQGGDLTAKARWITDRLLIDAQAGPSQFKTRAGHAIETIQGLLHSLRTGQLSDTHPNLSLSAPRFEEEWEWMGSYATWRAAMSVFLYPENLLLPTLRRNQTSRFRDLSSQLRANRRLSSAQARAMAASYDDYFQDVCSLSLETSCAARTARPDGGEDALFYIYGTGAKTRAIYWSATGPDGSQTFWDEVPRPEGFVKLVASVPFTVEEEQPFIFLFAQVLDEGKPGLAFLRYNLATRAWDAEWTTLDLPAERGRHDIIAVQNQDATEPPGFFIRAPNGMHVRSLDAEGADWETPASDEEASDDWKAFRIPGYPTGTSTLCAVIRTADQPPGTYWLCRQAKSGGVIVLKQSNIPTAPKTVQGGGPIEIGGVTGAFAGAFGRGNADEVVVLFAAKPGPRPRPAAGGATPRALVSRQVSFRVVRPGAPGTDRPAAALNGLQRFVPRFDDGTDRPGQIAWQKAGERLLGALALTADTITLRDTARAAPKVDSAIPIVEDGPTVDQKQRRERIQAAVTGNQAIASNLAYVAEACFFVPMLVASQMQARGQYIGALDWYRSVYDYRLPADQRKIYHGLRLEDAQAVPPALTRTPDWLLDPLDPHAIAASRPRASSRGALLSLVGCCLDFADAEFTRDSSESLPRARVLYLTALELLGAPDLAQPGPAKLASALPGPSGDFDIAPNGLLAALRMRAEINLFKLRTGRNIAGLERQVEPYAAPTDADGAMPSIGGGGVIALPRPQTLRPTPYRYPVLIERAKQLAQMAAQMEAAMLAAIEKRDAEFYNLLKARQDVKLTRAGVRLQDLRLREAEEGVKLAQLQQERAQVQENHYQNLLDEGLLLKEAVALMLLHVSLAVPDSIGLTGPAYSPSGKLATLSGELSTIASYERRAQEWEFQRLLAAQDIAIGTQQVRLADDHVRIVGQERVIADMQAEHAEASLDFLAGKFTSAELFDWMSGVLEGVYSYFLQQATAIAKLAENQLAFDRQALPPAVIQADYWQMLNEANPPASNGASENRRGLTGSARLLQDIFRLDQHAFETDQRKLQLSRTISLAQLAPIEFQRFRETGTIVFATPMALFDQDFPGHYLRLVKRVRVSVVALIPPSQGIRATLSTSAVSRVVTGTDDGGFCSTVFNHGAQSVSLTSPQNATGLFDLDVQSDMRLPFEGIGVDAVWRLDIPKAANPFDYRTISDVLLTIDYTALASEDLRRQVIQTLPRTLSFDRPFSLRYQFADAWYDLHNPVQTGQPMSVRFATQRGDFPPNLSQLKIQHVALYFARNGGPPFEVQDARLQFSPPAGGNSVGGPANSIDGIISTRRGNASTWQAIQTKEPAGSWQLTLPETAEMKGRFTNGEIDDILLVLTCSGQTAAWPS